MWKDFTDFWNDARSNILFYLAIYGSKRIMIFFQNLLAQKQIGIFSFSILNELSWDIINYKGNNKEKW